MATVHPSRMRLIPEGLREAHRGDSRTRSPSPRRRSRSPRRTRSRTPDRERDRNRETDRGRDRDRDDKGRSDYREPEKRRASPQYEDYRRPPPPHMADNRGHDNMYPPRQDRHGHAGAVPYGSAGGDFMESRRLQREKLVVDIWPPSPKHPARDLSPPRKKSSKHSKRRRSVSSDSDSEDDDKRRKEKKDKKRAKRKEKDERREKRKHRRSRSRGHGSEDDNESDQDRKHRSKHRRTHSPERERAKDRDEDDERRAHRHRHRTRSKSKSRSKSRAKTEERMDIDKHEKPHRHPSAPGSSAARSRQGSFAPSGGHSDDDDDDDEVGPQPMYKMTGNKKVDERAYGGALLRGEGSAMAAFLQDGTESRIPRRGEIGLTPDEIAKYEDVGYVMSGSRHKRMNAVRMRKENQVISAEEKRGILKLQKEERDRRELILREELLDMMNEKLKSQAIGSRNDRPVD